MTTYLELHKKQWPKRMKILRACVELEGATSDFLRQVFKLKDSSITFGMSTKALSFEHKLNLMLDLASITSDDRKRFQMLQEMRNQFAHNDACISYEIYFMLAKKSPDKLFAWYPVPTKGTLEQRLEKVITLWLKDLDRIRRNAERMIGSRLLASTREKMNTAALHVHRAKRTEFYDRFEDRKSYNGEEVKAIVSEIFRDIERESGRAMDVAIQKELRGEE
ncbi:MAG: hypothetical protein ABI432_00470 [Flavobacteriales bacterium]